LQFKEELYSVEDGNDSVNKPGHDTNQCEDQYHLGEPNIGLPINDPILFAFDSFFSLDSIPKFDP